MKFLARMFVDESLLRITIMKLEKNREGKSLLKFVFASRTPQWIHLGKIMNLKYFNVLSTHVAIIL